MPEPLKNSYNRAYIKRLAETVRRHHTPFKVAPFIKAVLDKEWEQRELKARMAHIRHCLHQAINLPFEASLAVLLPAAKDFGGYEGMFFPDYVEVYGLDHWDASMDALAELTQYSSSEFAVRPFIEKDPKRMMAQMKSWAGDDNHHVRRLASEGCRPRLPWARALPAFKQDPAPILPILSRLRRDDSLYVRRSVANNLNDIAKDNPDVVLQWATKNKGKSELTDWIIKHGCRTLLKRAHPEALSLFGFNMATTVKVRKFKLSEPKLDIGDELFFSFQIASADKPLGKLRIEYAIDYLKANGELSRKVFKISEGDYQDNLLAFERRQSFRQMTTRVHYPGKHRIAIIINGVELALKPFELGR